MNQKRAIISVLTLPLLLLILLCTVGCECEHAYDSDSKCTDITCTKCGYVHKQEHTNERAFYAPATLLSGGREVLKCTECGERSKYDIPQLTPDDLNMPAVYLTDFADNNVPIPDMVKHVNENKVYFRYESNCDDIESFDCTAIIKIQGSTSAGFPKKNFTVKLYQDETFAKGTKMKVDFGWGKENKYCLKANWIDFSHARNIVGANMFADIVDLRQNPNENLVNSPNNGLIDGFPLLVYVNGEFHGLYTLNIPRDEWAFGMDGDETTREALLIGDGWTDSSKLYEPIGSGDFKKYGWALEYASTENTDIQWVKDSFNQMIEILNSGDRERIENELCKHLDIEAAIDNMLFTFFLNASDNTAKNIYWATYDGVLWIPSMYDMDGTFGLWWNGDLTHSDLYPTFESDGTIKLPNNKMYRVLIEYFSDAVKERWGFLRESILTLESTKARFDAFYQKVPTEAYEADKARWLGTGAQYEAFHFAHHTNYYEATKAQLERLDAFFDHFN